jgi:hypothetical protein
MKARGGTGGIASVILNLGTSCTGFSLLLEINNVCNGMTSQELCAVCYINSKSSEFFFILIENCLVVYASALNRF